MHLPMSAILAKCSDHAQRAMRLASRASQALAEPEKTPATLVNRHLNVIVVTIFAATDPRRRPATPAIPRRPGR